MGQGIKDPPPVRAIGRGLAVLAAAIKRHWVERDHRVMAAYIGIPTFLVLALAVWIAPSGGWASVAVEVASVALELTLVIVLIDWAISRDRRRRWKPVFDRCEQETRLAIIGLRESLWFLRGGLLTITRKIDQENLAKEDVAIFIGNMLREYREGVSVRPSTIGFRLASDISILDADLAEKYGKVVALIDTEIEIRELLKGVEEVSMMPRLISSFSFQAGRNYFSALKKLAEPVDAELSSLVDEFLVKWDKLEDQLDKNWPDSRSPYIERSGQVYDLPGFE